MLAPGQEALIRTMARPPLPTGWTFLGASIAGSVVRARYRGPREGLAAELRVAHGEPLSVQVRASLAHPSVSALTAALVASVRAHAPSLQWSVPVPSAEAPESNSPTLDPPPVPEKSPGREVLLRWLGPLGEYLCRALAHEPVKATLTTALLALQSGDLPAGLAALEALRAPEAPTDARLAAEALRFEALRLRGCALEAREALDEALRRFPEEAPLHEASSALHAALHAPDEALASAHRALELAPHAPGTTLRCARALLAVGRTDEAVALLGPLTDDPHASDALLRDLASVHLEAGAFTVAEALALRVLSRTPEDPTALEALGTLGAWLGDASTARSHGEALTRAAPERPSGDVLLGAAAMLEGDAEGALGCFDQALSRAPGDPLARVWRAEALLRLGRAEDALAAARLGGEHSDDLTRHVAAQTLTALAQARLGAFPGLPDEAFAQALEALHRTPPALVSRDPTARLEDALRKLRGNRSEGATYVTPEGALVRLSLGPTVRVPAKRALWRFVATGDPQPAVRALESLADAFPEAPEPFTYLGELHLDLGDTSRARGCFERALERYPRARWAYIGLGAVATLEGRPAEALDTLRHGAERAGGEGPTAVVWRGEALRLLGRLPEAREALALAVERHPSRCGAWVNLALVHLAEGDLSRARVTLARLRTRAKGFVDDGLGALGHAPGAWRTLPDARLPVLAEALLAMLRGNRSGSCVTYFTPEGVLRTVPPREAPSPSKRALRAALRGPWAP